MRGLYSDGMSPPAAGKAFPEKAFLTSKRLFDIAGGTAGCLAAVILLGIVKAVYVFSGDTGPVIYRQTRIGKHGRPFTIYKIRTMVDGAEDMLEEIDHSTESGLRDRAIIELLYSGGLRVSELVGLNRDSINLERREFMVRGKGSRIDRFLSQKRVRTECGTTSMHGPIPYRRFS